MNGLSVSTESSSGLFSMQVQAVEQARSQVFSVRKDRSADIVDLDIWEHITRSSAACNRKF